jgi:fatty-acyl-CoA synthase
VNASYAHGTSATPLIGDTIGDYLDKTAAEYAGNEALVSVFENQRFTYRQLLDEVNQHAGALMRQGVQKGDRIGIWSTNCVAWVLLQFATAKIGAILVNINPAYRTHELDFALKQSECNYLFHGEGFRDANYAEMLSELAIVGQAPRLPSVQHNDGRRSACPTRNRFLHLRGVIALKDWKPTAVDRAKLAARQASLDRDEVINIQYTSGTTGFPKGAMLTHHNILNNGFWVGERMRLTPRDRLCIPVPFYHCFGMVLGNLACVTHGATMVLPAPHFSPLATLQAIEKEKCTAVHGVPTMFISELDHPEFKKFDLSSLRAGIMAGAPCPIEVMNRVIDEMHCREITIACGQTETSPVCNMTEVDDPIELRVGSVGKVLPHQEQKIVDPVSGKTLPRGEQGELCYRGYQVMRGYHNDPEATRQAIDPSGWLHSGDLAVMDEQGYVKITGRLKDMICRGGEKIFPRELEEYLFTHPKIAEVAVIGVPDRYYGEEVMAWVRVKEPMNADEVRSFCRGKIMDYKIPKYVKFVDEFPTTVTGKIQKYKMREISAAELGEEC